MNIVIQARNYIQCPNWIVRCTESVRDWAVSNGYEYYCEPDGELFARVPRRFKENAHKRHVPSRLGPKSARSELAMLSDYARLLMAREALAAGFGRVLWLDSDVLVFDDDFRVPMEDGVAVARTYIPNGIKNGRMFGSSHKSPAGQVWVQGAEELADYIEYCEQTLEGGGKLHGALLGSTRLDWWNVATFPLAYFTPFFHDHIQAVGIGRAIGDYERASGFVPQAANLCASYRDTVPESTYEETVTALLGLAG